MSGPIDITDLAAVRRALKDLRSATYSASAHWFAASAGIEVVDAHQAQTDRVAELTLERDQLLFIVRAVGGEVGHDGIWRLPRDPDLACSPMTAKYLRGVLGS